MRSAVLSAAGIAGRGLPAVAAPALVGAAPPSGVENPTPTHADAAQNVSPDFVPPPGTHYRLIQAILRAQTDAHAELLSENEWLLHTNEADLRLSGNAFAIENVLDSIGVVYLKLAPLPAERPEAVA